MKNNIVIITIATIFVIFVSLSILLLFNNADNSNNDLEVSGITNSKTPEEDLLIITVISFPVSYTENKITFENPSNNDFRINVKADKSGMKYSVENSSYSGTTQIEILDSNNISILKISGVDGVGGNTNIRACLNFDDMDHDFYSSLEDNQKRIALPYKEFLLFGSKVRLAVDNNLSYYFEEFSQKGNVFCEPIFFRFKDISFQVNDTNYKSNLYEVEINTEVDNEKIFKILSSLKI